MRTAILLRAVEWLCMDNCQDYAARIGTGSKGISARHLGSASSDHLSATRLRPRLLRCTHAPLRGAPRSPAEHGAAQLGQAAPAGRGEGRWGAHGGKAWQGLGKLEGRIANGIVCPECHARKRPTAAAHTSPRAHTRRRGLRRPSRTWLGAHG